MSVVNAQDWYLDRPGLQKPFPDGPLSPAVAAGGEARVSLASAPCNGLAHCAPVPVPGDCTFR